MAYTPVVLSAHADAPTFVVENVCEKAVLPSSPAGRWSADGDATPGTFSAIDRTDANFPILRAFDRFRHLVTRPSTAVVDNIWYLVLRAEKPTKGGATADADTILIDDHNFASISGGVTCRVETADDDLFTSNLVTIHDFGSITTAGRLLEVDGTQFQDLERVRIRCEAAGNFVPEIGEFFYGPRIVLARQPNIPWDEDHLFSDVGRFKSRNGMISTYVRYEGQRLASMTVQPDDSVEIQNLRDAFAFGGYGSKPFLFIDNPNTDPVGYFMVRDADNDMPLQGPFDRILNISMEEQAPFVATEV